jgi:hypothetical protein
MILAACSMAIERKKFATVNKSSPQSILQILFPSPVEGDGLGVRGLELRTRHEFGASLWVPWNSGSVSQHTNRPRAQRHALTELGP